MIKYWLDNKTNKDKDNYYKTDKDICKDFYIQGIYKKLMGRLLLS